ncbi:MAG: phosphatidylserine decarboxylase [Bdellovibrionales bacterium RIFOXYD1_FULL_44_7]|nr:MAG: phosphatidylserine decarboxylase [Bdellovibrionales bacterium RIFOXYD1_FULL_44_7]
MNEFVKYPNSPIAADGLLIVGGALVLTVVFFLFFWFFPTSNWAVKITGGGLAFASLVFLLFSLWFFRDPSRTPEQTGPDVVISAADGEVLKVETVDDVRFGEKAEKISIFMSPFNVHVNRAPVAGVVEKVEYVPGTFFVASLDKASTDNERNLVVIKTDKGQRVGFLQIAGLVARRIVWHIKVNDRLEIGQRYGMIKFGSRMEIFLPVGSQIQVKPGDRVFAGKTVVGRLVLP